MKNTKFNRFLAMLLIIMTLFSTSSSVNAAGTSGSPYLFKPGNNIITVGEFNSGVWFKVEKTGVYRFNMMPNVKDYEWKYIITYGNSDNNQLSLAAVKQEAEGKDVYKIYSDEVPYILLVGGRPYKIKKSDAHDKNKLLKNNSNETYITINLSNPEEAENGKYYEAKENPINKLVEEERFQMQYYKSGGENTHNQSNYSTSVEVTGVLGKEGKADLIQQLLTGYLITGLGNGAMFLIGVVAGEPITIDKILFNEYSRIRLAFFEKDYIDPDTGQPDPDKVNPLLETSGIIGPDGILNKFYNRFTLIAVVAYVTMLLYMAVRIILSSTGKDMAKYKKLFADWVVGVMILFLFPYVIRYTIKINDAVVSYIGNLRKNVVSIEEPEIIDYPGGLAFPFSYVGSEGAAAQDYMAKMKENALETGKLMYVLCWFLMIKELVAFLIIYLKRVLTTLFLIVVFPLVTISYAIDKIADGKSQAFNTWMKEFILNVFLQTFHAINYVVIMGIIFAISADNFIFILIGLTYLSNGDKIMRGIFSHMKGGGAGTVKNIGESMLATAAVTSMLKSSVNTIKNTAKGMKNLSDKKLEFSNKSSKIDEKNTQDKWDQWNLGQGLNANGFSDINSPDADSEGDVSKAMSNALDSRSSEDKIQNSVGYLRQASVAGGATQQAYENQMKELKAKNPKKYDELMELMNYSDAVDGLQNLEQLSEAEINAHLDVIIRNRNKRGNFKKLNSILEKQGINEKVQDKLKETLDKRKLTPAKEAELNRLRKSIYTKEDAQAVDKMKEINAQAEKIANKQGELESKKSEISAKRAELEGKIAKLQNDLKTKRMRGVHKNQKKGQIAKYKAQIAELDKSTENIDKAISNLGNGQLSYEDRKKLYELSEEKNRAASERVNKNIDESTEKVAHDKVAETEKYKAIARAASNGMLSSVQQEVAEAQAVLDGSNSGQYSIQELWKANQIIKKAQSSTDEGVKKILEASANSADAKPEGFDQMLATMVLENQKKLEGTHEDIQKTLAQAIETIKEKSEEGGIYQHILDDAHMAVITNKNGEKVVAKVEEDSLQRMISGIAEIREEAMEENRAVLGNEITDDESLRMMKSERFADALSIGAELVDVAVKPLSFVASTGAGLMLKGASPDSGMSEVMGTAMLAGNAVDKATGAVTHTVINTVDAVANRAYGIVDSARKGDLNVKKFASTVLYGDDNMQGVETRNRKIENASTSAGRYNEKMKTTLYDIEEKKKQLGRIQNNREAYRRGLTRNNNNS